VLTKPKAWDFDNVPDAVKKKKPLLNKELTANIEISS
jgi:hypothetical protein